MIDPEVEIWIYSERFGSRDLHRWVKKFCCAPVHFAAPRAPVGDTAFLCAPRPLRHRAPANPDSLRPGRCPKRLRPLGQGRPKPPTSVAPPDGLSARRLPNVNKDHPHCPRRRGARQPKHGSGLGFLLLRDFAHHAASHAGGPRRSESGADTAEHRKARRRALQLKARTAQAPPRSRRTAAGAPGVQSAFSTRAAEDSGKTTAFDGERQRAARGRMGAVRQQAVDSVEVKWMAALAKVPILGRC